MKQEKLIQKIFIIIFFIILSFFMITTIFNNEKISTVERRSLQTFPSFNINKLFSKKYYDDLAKAFQDQLELREYLVKGYFLFQFQRYYGDAVIGDNNELYSPSQKTLSDTYYKNLEKVTNNVNIESKKTNAKFIFLSIPRKDAYMTKDLPKTYNSSNNIYKKQVKIVKENLDNNIIFIDAYDVFKEKNIYNCYYSNDHHVTPRCAYLLYEKINEYTDVKSYQLEKEFEIKQTIVNGAYNRQLGQTIKSKPEDLYLIPKKEIKYTRYEDNKLSNKKVYGKGNTYEEAYMEGDMAFTRIETNKKNKPSIMFVGSSYTNILEALSVPSYNKVISVDYRHNKTRNDINYYVDKYDIDYVIFIPAQSNNSFSIERINLYLNK